MPSGSRKLAWGEGANPHRVPPNPAKRWELTGKRGALGWERDVFCL